MDDLSQLWTVEPYGRPGEALKGFKEERRPEILTNRYGKTFRDAAESYVKYGGRTQYLPPIVEWLGDTLLEDIIPFDLTEKAKESWPHLKNSTKNRQFLTPIRAVLNHAYKRRWCIYLRIDSLKEEAPKEKVPASALWLYLFFRQCEKENAQHVAALVMFMAHTGARISEAIRVEWDHVDLQGRTAVLVKTKTETNSERFLTDELVDRLYKLQGQPNIRNPTRVFHYKCRYSVNERIKSICERAEIEYKSSHACGRVTYATMAIAMGLDVPTAMKGGGWKSVTVFLGRYAKPGKDAGRRVAEKFNRLQYDGRA